MNASASAPELVVIKYIGNQFLLTKVKYRAITVRVNESTAFNRPQDI